jgi:arylsulfatase A-like enzyme
MRKILILFTIAIFLFSWTEKESESQPNIIVILTDDQGWGDLSISGNTNLSTPNIDKLAETGVTFDRFYVSPVCSPTRAEMLTGRYHVRGGVYSTSAGGERLDLDETTIAQVFKNAGYATAEKKHQEERRKQYEKESMEELERFKKEEKNKE